MVRGHSCQAFINLASASAFPGAHLSQLGSQNLTHIHTEAGIKQAAREGDKQGQGQTMMTVAEKAVVGPSAAPEKAVVVRAAAPE